MTDQRKVQIFGIEDAGPSVERGLFKKSSELRLGRGEVDAGLLKERIHGLLSDMQDILESVPDIFGSFQLDTVNISAEISAKGSVSLLGTGAEIAGQGGMTFTLRRKQSSAADGD